MARSPAQRGKVGNWLVESRLARGWDTQALARDQIAKFTSWRIPQSVYAEWESGRRMPSDANLDRLRAFYGDAPETTETPDSLIQALTAQTQAISELAATLQALLGIEIRPDTPEIAEARRIIREGFLRGPILDEAEASGSAEGSRRARVHEDPEPLVPSPAPRTRGSGARRG